jgi:hypothetical protein
MIMDKNLIFRIGAISLGLVGNSGYEYAGQERFINFLSPIPPQATYNITFNTIPAEPTSKPYFDGGIRWRLYNVSGRWLLWVGSRGQDPYLAGSFKQDYHSGEIYTSISKDKSGKFVFPLSYPMGELLVTNLLGTGYGIMLHSCGVIYNNNGIVFAGFGRAGKSTTARLWNGLTGVRVLNDDHTILRKINGEFRVFGTPWHGRGGFALAADASLKKLFILKHAQTNQAKLIPPAEASAELLVRTFPPLWSASAMTFTLQFLDELCHTVPCYELGFVPDQSAVEYVRCLSWD